MTPVVGTDAPTRTAPVSTAPTHASHVAPGRLPSFSLQHPSTLVPLSEPAQGFIASLGSRDFDLFVRTIELVVQSQAYSRVRLQHALGLTPGVAAQLTEALVILGVLEDGEPDDPRLVLVDVPDLAALLADVHSHRRDALGSTTRASAGSAARAA